MDEVSTLAHKALVDSMEVGAFVAKSSYSDVQLKNNFCGLWTSSLSSHIPIGSSLTVDIIVKENPRIGHGAGPEKGTRMEQG